MTQTHAKTFKQKHLSMVCSILLLILNISYLHHIHCKKCPSPNINMSRNLYFDMMTPQVVVTFPQERFILVLKKYSLNVRNTIFYQMLITY